MLLAAMGGLAPKISIVLGSGLGGLADKVESPVTVAYKNLAGFPELSVAGHAGEVVAGRLSGTPVIMLKGRKHLYETNDFYPLKTMIRTMQAVGVEKLFLSCASGSLNPAFKVGELMAISDHINFMGINPLVGSNDDAFGPRFPPMSNAWDDSLRGKLKTAAKKLNMTLHEGVYFAMRGPAFETPAEIRMAQKLGGDAVGMSGVPECLVARHAGLKVLGVACITNMGEGLSSEKLSHAHTLENAKLAAVSFERLVAAVLPEL